MSGTRMTKNNFYYIFHNPIYLFVSLFYTVKSKITEHREEENNDGKACESVLTYQLHEAI